jgi:type I restriction enzyme S subunit
LGEANCSGLVVIKQPRQVDADYLVHFLNSPEGRRKSLAETKGSTRQTLNTKAIAAAMIPVPLLSEQRRIAEVLDRAEALRAKRRAALARLDTLTQTLFLDLFGDPATNPRKWPRKAVGELASKFSDGPFGSNLKSSHYTEAGVRVVRLQNIGVGQFVDSDKAYISEQHFADLKKHECLPGDVLVGTLGEPNLRACIQPHWLPVALNKADCVQLRPDGRTANAPYLCALLNQPATERMARRLIVGQTRLRISMGRLRGLEVPVPPVSLQQDFAGRVAAVEKLKAAHRASLAELDALFAALQHRAFRGEL